jgi:hypothetical protein
VVVVAVVVLAVGGGDAPPAWMVPVTPGRLLLLDVVLLSVLALDVMLPSVLLCCALAAVGSMAAAWAALDAWRPLVSTQSWQWSQYSKWLWSWPWYRPRRMAYSLLCWRCMCC